MKIINLKSGHIQIYKRENSKSWQMKLKYPKEKAIRLSTGTKILNDAKKISLDLYYKHSTFKIREDKKNKNDFKKFVNNEVSFNTHIMVICKSKEKLKRFYEDVFPWLEKCEKIFGFEHLSGY